MALSRAQAVQVYYNAGFRGNDLVTIVAIAGRESGYRPDAHRTDNPGSNPPTGDFGLTQINYIHDTPAMRAAAGYSSINDLFDPNVNARVAYQLFKANHGFSSWAAGPKGYTGGGDPLYGTDVPAAVQAVMDFLLAKGDSTPLGQMPPMSGIPGVGPIISAPGKAIGAVKDSINSVTDFLKLLADSATWIRVLQVVGGLISVGVGFWIITHQSTDMVPKLSSVATAAAVA